MTDTVTHRHQPAPHQRHRTRRHRRQRTWRPTLQTYRISGVKPVIEALEGAVGAAVLQPDVTERVKATEEGDRFWKRMGRAFAALQAVQTAYQLVESVAKHLPMLGGG